MEFHISTYLLTTPVFVVQREAWHIYALCMPEVPSIAKNSAFGFRLAALSFASLLFYIVSKFVIRVNNL